MAPDLTAFWISFPDDRGFPLGLGVTAHSKDDAFQLLEDQGYDFHLRARSVDVKVQVGVADLDLHVRTDMGPIVVRGVWYPCFNIGFGAGRRH
ncbi:MAG: hypothetical protein H0T46_29875 [Deltaproteobacteria bacterium]|nr:hypothetical protein [Deltaproteobacteria bacterium]